jgi:tRNA pseudouridine38-40 synthase
MANYKLEIEYDGTKYKGWQRLENSGPTIQGKIEGVLTQLLDESIEIIGSGRTDAGVHALGQVANFKTKQDLPSRKILEYLNQYLPEDIVVKKVEAVDERFHSRIKAVNKTYLYKIWNGSVPSAIHRKFSYHVPGNLDVKAMIEGGSYLVGKHDFIAFSSLKKIKKSTEREIYKVDITRSGNLIEIAINGEGFLYNMVRIIVGTLINIGQGKVPPDAIQHILKSKDRQLAGETVPPQGLFLVKVNYDIK